MTDTDTDYDMTIVFAASPLLAACDVLVTRALEMTGKRIVSNPRSRRGKFKESGLDFHEAHTLWRPLPEHVEKSLANAWTSVPRLVGTYGCCGASPEAVTRCLLLYTRDLLITGTPHTVQGLLYRFDRDLGISFPFSERVIQ